MTSPSLHFLGWSRPAVETVCDFLLAGATPPQPFDLEGTLLVVPTQQAGRHLMDALVQRCSDAGTAVLSQRVVTPTQLAANALRQPNLASGAELVGVWSEVLAAADETLLLAAFGASGRSREPAVTVSMAERLQQVRRELAEAARTCAAVAALADAASAEQERWQALAQLEAAFLARLAQNNLCDPCAAQIAWAAKPQLAPEVRRVVVACVPDPSLLLVGAMERLARQVAIELLVQAPPEEAAHFDAWGRPLPEHWHTRRIEIPDEEQNLLLVADPAAQARRIVEIMTSEAAKIAASDVAIGVPDRATVPFLIAQLASRGVPAFDPQERPLREHPLCGLIARLLDLRRAAPYRTVAELLRHPDVLTALQQNAPALDPTQLLTQLDEFQNHHLPLGLPDLLRPFEKNPRGTNDQRADFTSLGLALQRVAQWRDRLTSERLPVVLRALLAELYASRELDPELPADRLFAAAAEAIDRVLRELEDARLPPMDAELEATVLSARLRSQGCTPERGHERIDLEGWLELPWNRAPLLFVAGMNEGLVPDGRLADDFLPDALHRVLGLRDDGLRAARDAFLLHLLIAARADGRGRVCLLCGKSSAEGDPLRPSRLLFRCDDARLPQRALRLFGALPATRPSAPATIGFSLRPFSLAVEASRSSALHSVNALEGRAPRALATPGGGGPPPSKENIINATPSISVTQFKDYLRCPFRFYLKHRLEMAPLADDPLAPDELAFGNFVHDALRDFARDPALARCADAEKLAARLAQLVRARFAARYGSRPSLAVQVALESAIQRLGRFAALQVELLPEWEIISNEERFTLQRGNCEIVARIDRIDRHRRDGRLRVMDYKTFDKVRTPADVHLGACRADAPVFAQVALPDERGRGRRKAWQELQLPLYREALIATGRYDGDKLELGYFILPRAIGETGFQPWSGYTAALHDAAMSCADGVLAAIAAGIYWPPRDVPPDWDDFAMLFVGPPEKCFDPPDPPHAIASSWISDGGGSGGPALPLPNPEAAP